MRKEFLHPIFFHLANIVDGIFLRICPIIYMGITRSQASHDRFIFGSDIIKENKTSDNINVLDVGCGSGNFYAYLKSFFSNFTYLGIDFSTNQIKSSKFKKKNFEIAQQDLRKDWFYGEFDFVWSSEVIEHVLDDQFFFQNLVKSTKREGYIILTTPHIDSFVNFAKKFGWSTEPSKVEDGGHVRLGYNEKDIENFAKKFNLKLINTYFISECNDFRAKIFDELNAGIRCYIFNLLYFFKILRYKRYLSLEKVENKLKYYCIGAVFKRI